MRGISTKRRTITLIAVGAVASLALAACSSGSSNSGGDASEELKLSKDKVTLKFSWWGNDVRTKATQQIIADFEAKYPNITIEPSFTDWAGYWDKLATETAAGDAPDIIQMDEKYIATYGGRGALYDLSTVGKSINLKDFPKQTLQSGTVDDALYGIPAGITSYSIVVNPTVLKEAGVKMPDDKTWTWEEYAELGEKVSKAGGGDVFGMQPGGFEDGGLNNWARQHGDALYNDKGEVVIKEKTLTSWWTYLQGLIEDGASPSASAVIEKQGGGLAESFTATNKVGFGPWWNSQLTALSKASGNELQLLRVPTVKGKADGSAYYKPSMFWSVGAKTEHPAEAALFVDYLVNSKTAADSLLTERGVPANEKIRKYIEPKLAETDKAVVEFLDGLSDDIGDAPPVTPAGGSAIEAVLKQYTEQVFFGKATPKEAAKGFIKDMKDAIAAG